MDEIWERSQTVDPEVRAYVYSLVNAVGGSSTVDDGNTYQIGDDALAALHDIQRWLRLYDDKLNRYDVARCLAEASLVRGDLLEILALWPEEAQDNRAKAKLALACLQLLVPLTWPFRLEEEKTTVNHVRHMPYLQLAQVAYKRVVLGYEHAKILRTAVRIGLPSMVVGRRERSRRDEGIIKLVMYLFRNIAMITQPQHLPSQGDENEISRSSTIEAFQDQEAFSLVLTIGSNADTDFHEQDVILLDILFHLLKGVDTTKLFMRPSQVDTHETDELKKLMQKERAMQKGYNRHAPTRHNRFGTMLWVKRDDMKMSTVTGQHTITDESTTLHHMDASKKWDKPKYRGKMVHDFDEHSDFGMRVDLTEPARNHLRSFVEDFLDSSFNPLFSSLRKAIEREADRVRDENKRQYFYLISWFLSAEQARRSQTNASTSSNADRPTQTNPGDNTYAYIAAVLDQETFVLLNRYMQRAYDEKRWQDLQPTLLCFTQILLTVQTMAESEDEEDQEIAENIQNRIFYEESTHDRIVQILRGYSNQGFAYLDAITECTHVFVRMLERYSKQNVDLQIRSKRRARKKRKQQQPQADVQPGDDADQAEEDEREANVTVSERTFDFARFSAKIFSYQTSVDTFISLLHYYADLTPSQLKRCHRFFYRLAFKQEMALLLFRVDVLLLLHRMIKGSQSLDPETEGFKDWEMLVQQIFRRCIKWLEKDTEGNGWKETCVVEMLFSKVPAMQFYLQNGYERVVERRGPRAPAELEFKGFVEAEKRVGVAVSLLLERGEGAAVEWVKRQLERAVEERQAWQDERETRFVAVEESASTQSLAPAVFLSPDGEERRLALFKDKHLRLLLATLGFQRLGPNEDVDASWIVPSAISSQQLKESIEQIKKAEFDPLTFNEGRTAEDCVRNKSSSRRRTTGFSDHDSEDDDGEGEGERRSGGDIDESLFPPNLRDKRKDGAERPAKRRRLTRRNKGELTEAEAAEIAAARRRKEGERNGKIKSQLYVTASDDESDEERDAEFFRLEEERRKQTAGMIRSALLREGESGAAGKKKKGGKKRKTRNESDDERTELSMAMDFRGDVESDDEELQDGDLDTSARKLFKARYAPSREIIPHPRSMDSGESDGSGGEEMERGSSVAEEEDDNDHSEGVVVVEEEEETPSTSPTAAEKGFEGAPLKEVSGNAVPAKQSMGSDDDENEGPLKRVARRSVRAGFIDESDSETQHHQR